MLKRIAPCEPVFSANREKKIGENCKNVFKGGVCIDCSSIKNPCDWTDPWNVVKGHAENPASKKYLHGIAFPKSGHPTKDWFAKSHSGCRQITENPQCSIVNDEPESELKDLGNSKGGKAAAKLGAAAMPKPERRDLGDSFGRKAAAKPAAKQGPASKKQKCVVMSGKDRCTWSGFGAKDYGCSPDAWFRNSYNQSGPEAGTNPEAPRGADDVQYGEIRNWMKHCVKQAFDQKTRQLKPEFRCKGTDKKYFEDALKSF